MSFSPGPFKMNCIYIQSTQDFKQPEKNCIQGRSICKKNVQFIFNIIVKILKSLFLCFFKEVLQSNVIINDKSKKSYIERLNNSLHSNNHFKKDLPNTKGPFHIKLQLGENVFYGSAHSIQAAKHNAASNAIDFLLENKDILETECLNEGKSSTIC